MISERPFKRTDRVANEIHNILGYIQEHNLGVFISNHKNNKDGILYYGLKNYGEHWYLKDRQNSKNQFLMASDSLSKPSFIGSKVLFE